VLIYRPTASGVLRTFSTWNSLSVRLDGPSAKVSALGCEEFPFSLELTNVALATLLALRVGMHLALRRKEICLEQSSAEKKRSSEEFAGPYR
jgi:hypothetical protein